MVTHVLPHVQREPLSTTESAQPVQPIAKLAQHLIPTNAHLALQTITLLLYPAMEVTAKVCALLVTFRNRDSVLTALVHVLLATGPPTPIAFPVSTVLYFSQAHLLPAMVNALSHATRAITKTVNFADSVTLPVSPVMMHKKATA